MGKMKAMAQELMEQGVQELNVDYAIYIGNVIVEDGKTKTGPIEYLEEYMEAHEQPPYEVCVGFLLQFYTYDTVADWTSHIAWDEDEEQELEPLNIQELTCIIDVLAHYEEFGPKDGPRAEELLARTSDKVMAILNVTNE